MHILIAPTAFKGSFSPLEVSDIFARAVQKFKSVYKLNHLSFDILPLVDGGDGTVESLHVACGGNFHTLEVSGAIGERRTAFWLENDGLAVVELASACGIANLRKEELKPLKASTRGLGQVIKAALQDQNIKELVITLGGSASTDGGVGALFEMGMIILDKQGRSLEPEGAKTLELIDNCNLDKVQELCRNISLKIVTDVTNPLLGKFGAAAIFGPQKGASEQDINLLENSLSNFARVIEKVTGRECKQQAGSGAAGGTAFGLACATGAEIYSGFNWFADRVSLERRIAKADLILSGEGSIDISSFYGKTIGSLINKCLPNTDSTRVKKNCQIWIFVGKIDFNIEELEKAVKNKILLIECALNDKQFAFAQDIETKVFQALLKYYDNEHDLMNSSSVSV